MVQQLESHINKQIKLNSGKNLLAKRDDMFQFMALPDSVIQELKTINKNEEVFLIDYITNKSLEEFYRLNQYYYFSSTDTKMLKAIYVNLLQYLKNDNDLATYEQAHFNKLRTWLTETNPFALKLYSRNSELLQGVVCEEYKARLQLDLLHIDVKNINEPVLDIGCGKNATLVKQLRKMGIDAFGFDRICYGTERCMNSDWFVYNFGNSKWGTIISNLSFTNHFNHHHLRSGGNYIAYAQTYMQILRSLMPDGSFYYAPGLPFIEKYLEPTKYTIDTFDVNQTGLKATVVMKKLEK